MTLRDDLVTGLQELKERLERIALKSNISEGETMACGYIVGYINHQIPAIKSIDRPELLDAALRDVLAAFKKEQRDE